MRLTLHYQGPLASNGGRDAKHALRQHFHRQLSVLYHRKPLMHFAPTMNLFQMDNDLYSRVGQFVFLPLVADYSSTTVSLDVTFLRPGATGEVVSHSGDLDNRLKTLFDGLTMPQENQLPDGSAPDPSEEPFYCLLSDDKLIGAVSVRSLELLDTTFDRRQVIAIINVSTEVIYAHDRNQHLR